MIKKISTSKIKDYLKNVFSEVPKWYVGQIDENQEKAVALYANRRQQGILSNYKEYQTYDILPITILIKWTKYYNQAEKEANNVYELLNCSSFFIDEYKCYAQCLYNGPIDLGPDENGVYKFSIELNLLYGKGER